MAPVWSLQYTGAMTKNTTTIIELNGVTKKFGVYAAANNISFTVREGEVVGFVGENGAGKTTTINMLLGFTSPTKGTVKLFGSAMRPGSAHISHRSIGYASGDMSLPEDMTGEQYIQFAMAQTPGDHSARYRELATVFRPQIGKKIGDMSRGNKQKIALVAAFVTNPKLVILDEPTSGLDPVMQDVFLDTIRDMAAHGTTVFMSSHYLQEVAEVSTRVLLMKQGRIMEDLTAEQLERRGGKIVTLTTKHAVTLPKDDVVIPTSTRRNGYYETSFDFIGKPSVLTKWLSGVTGVIDVTITDRTLEHEFKSVYESEVGDE